MKKNVNVDEKKKALLDSIGKTEKVLELLAIGAKAERVSKEIKLQAYKKAIASAKDIGDFQCLIEDLSYGDDDDRVLATEAAIAGAKKFKDQLRWQHSDNDEGMELWEKSELQTIINAIDEFLGDYLLIERITNPEIKNEDYEWRDVGERN